MKPWFILAEVMAIESLRVLMSTTNSSLLKAMPFAAGFMAWAGVHEKQEISNQNSLSKALKSNHTSILIMF